MTVRTFSVSVRRGAGRDTWGEDRDGTTTHTIDGCTRWPRNSSESLDRSDVVLSGWTLVVPPGSDIVVTDEVRMPDDAPTDPWWQVEGDPMAAARPYASPLSDWDPGVPVTLTRTRG